MILVLAFGILGVSSSSILVRLVQGQDMPSLVIAAWRLTLASGLLLPLALTSRRMELRSMSSSAWLLALFSGTMLAIHFASWISSLSYTSVASSTVLVTTAPLWVGLAAPIFLHEKLGSSMKRALGLAMAGSVLIGLADVVAVKDGRLLFGLSQFSSQTNPLLGNGLALIGAIAASAYLMTGRRLRSSMSLLCYTTVVYSTAAVVLVGMALAGGYQLFGYPAATYLTLLLMAIFPQLVGHSSYNWALGHFSATAVAVAVIAEPIGATILALIIFREIPKPLTIVGSALLLGGIVYAGRTTGKPSPAANDTTE